MVSWDVILLVFFFIAAIGTGLYFLNKWAYKKMNTQQSIIERSKQAATIYVIDKKKMKAADSNLPKSVTAQLPKLYKYLKVYLVKAKIGPQILTLMCEKKVFEALPVMKNVKVELAGIYIVSVKKMNTDKNLKTSKKQKKWWESAKEKAFSLIKK